MRLKLKVDEAYQDDVNLGIVRVDSELIEKYNFKIGDAVGIFGKRETIAIIQRAWPSDIGKKIIRVDGITRKNAKIGIGDTLEIFKIELKKAEKIVLAPLQDIPLHPSTLNSLRKSFLNKPLKEGDIICGQNKSEVSFSIQADGVGEELFNSMLEKFMGFNLSNLKFKVLKGSPSGFLLLTAKTNVEIVNKVDSEDNSLGVNYEDIGGLKNQLLQIRELVELPLKHPEIFNQLGISPPKGILLHGPPGTGKTLIAKAIANETQASFFSISAPEIINKYYGESEKKLRELFKKAEENAPSILFIDELDAIAQKREEVQGETEKRIVAQLLTLMDGIKSSEKVLVMAATNILDSIDGALRRPGRFDRELEIGIPKQEDRFEILKIHTRGMPLEIPKDIESYKKQLLKSSKENKLNVEKIDNFNSRIHLFDQIPKEIIKKVQTKNDKKLITEISKLTHGFVGADLESLVKETAFNVVRRNFSKFDLNTDKEISKEILANLEISKQDFLDALKIVRPSALREFSIETPNIRWEEIGGLEDLKQKLIEMIEWPIKHPQAFKRIGIKAPKGILLYGPPGTGKTLLGKAIATESNSNFIYIKGPEIVNKYIGESEKTIRNIFQKARQNSPCILFFDEFDSIGKVRSNGNSENNLNNIVTQILTEMDGLEDLINVKVIAATNRPNLIDPALLRAGRFDKLVLVDIPSIKSREKILEIHTKNTKIENKELVIKEVAKLSEGYVGADLENLVREAGLIVLRNNIRATELNLDNFIEALRVMRPSVNVEMQNNYKELEEEITNKKKEIKINNSPYL